MHFGTRRKINLCSDELLMGPFSHSLIFRWSSLVDSNYWIKMRWEIRTDPLFLPVSFTGQSLSEQLMEGQKMHHCIVDPGGLRKSSPHEI